MKQLHFLEDTSGVSGELRYPKIKTGKELDGDCRSSIKKRLNATNRDRDLSTPGSIISIVVPSGE
jgi:hypothetical protein